MKVDFTKEPRTMDEWVLSVAQAFGKRNEDQLYYLDRISEGWLQTKGEREAQERLIEVMIEALDELDNN